MTTSPEFPALQALRLHVAAQDGRLDAGCADLAMAALREFVDDGATLGRALRDDLARFKPVDAVGAAICYLFVVTCDAATHAGREAALGAYGESDQVLAPEAKDLYARLMAPGFRAQVGHRPVVRGGGRGCGS